MTKPSYEELEFNNWVLEFNLAQATILSAQARMKELQPMIQQRQKEFEAARCPQQELQLSPSPEIS